MSDLFVSVLEDKQSILDKFLSIFREVKPDMTEDDLVITEIMDDEDV